MDSERYILSKLRVKTFCNALIDMMIQYAEDKDWIDDIEVERRYSFSPYRSYCWAEELDSVNRRCLINFSFHSLLEMMNTNRPILYHSHEYDHIKDDPEIGNLQTVWWKRAAAMDVAHEVAHAIDFFCDAKYSEMDGYPDPTPCRGHGASWQYFYRILRREYVNISSFQILESIGNPTPHDGEFFSIIDYQKNNRYTYYLAPEQDRLYGYIRHREKFKIAYSRDGEHLGNFTCIYRARGKILNTTKKS